MLGINFEHAFDGSMIAQLTGQRARGFPGQHGHGKSLIQLQLVFYKQRRLQNNNRDGKLLKIACESQVSWNEDNISQRN